LLDAFVRERMLRRWSAIELDTVLIAASFGDVDPTPMDGFELGLADDRRDLRKKHLRRACCCFSATENPRVTGL
jgi:hypothetical protein